jgi:uroporphyrin-III C-methyltransferase/precorrin-2 dehydrogenase/sirohydrochlorin ferrochelatase
MRQLLVSYPLESRRVLIAGGGEPARRKVRLLASSPARLEVYASRLDPAFAAELGSRIVHEPRVPGAADFQGAALAIVAEEDEVLAAHLADAARKAGVPVNVVDRPDISDWQMPALVDRGEVVIGIATGGAAPVIARDLRARIELAVPKGVGLLAEAAKTLRDRVARSFPDADRRRAFWERALRGKAARRADEGDAASARAALIDAMAAPDTSRGVVHIVGAGPGDPDLLTLKAARLLQDADVIFHDALVSSAVLDLARRDAERIHVGKRRGVRSAKQDDIHALMIAAAAAGKRVVRLKGGDPFVFGRGGEELDALEDADVEAYVVPGITSALGCAAAIGAPLTHRDHAQAVTFVAGHAAGQGVEGGEPDLDWKALAKANQTVVVYMGVATAAKIAERLIAAGRDPSTPVAVVENGTRPDQKVAHGRLEDLGLIVVANEFLGPAVLIIGEVVGAAAEARRLANVETNQGVVR